MAWQHWVGKGSWGRRACVCMTSDASFSPSEIQFGKAKQANWRKRKMCHMAWGDKMMDGKKTKKEWCKQDNFAVKYKHKPMLPDDSIYDYFYLSIKAIRTNVIGNQISLVNKKKILCRSGSFVCVRNADTKTKSRSSLMPRSLVHLWSDSFFHDPDESRLCLPVGKWVFCVNWTIVTSFHYGKCPFQSLSRRRRTPKLLAWPSVIQHCCPVTVPASPVTRLMGPKRRPLSPPLLTPFSLFFLPFPSSSCFSFLFSPPPLFSHRPSRCLCNHH